MSAPDLTETLAASIAALSRPALVGLSGSQGSGKSTLAKALAARLPRTAVLSIDDFYLTHAERQALAKNVHPLLATRGVPGTHDIVLATATIDALLAGGDVSLPAFDKTTDDRVPESEWSLHRGPTDVVILEGWCVGARPQPAAMLADPVNALERDDDADGRWRAFVNELLAVYQPLFERIDLRIFLRAPGFEVVQGWRAEQEAGLARTAISRPPMSGTEIARFIAHYERITRWMIADAPADVVIDLDAERRPSGL